jgi:hypothetical protein
MSNPIFQLSALSQNDQPNSSCPGCASGTEITATILAYGGGIIYAENAPQPYPNTAFPLSKAVLLPIPPAPGTTPPPTPTWFMEVNNGIENAWFFVEIQTPGQSPTRIHVDGSSMAAWVAANQKEPTNQIYATGNCGVFGYAQENALPKQPAYWIYTLTAGVCNPQVNPPE